MKSYRNAFRAVALLAAWLTASNAYAEWLDTLTYKVAVSNSPSGPFASHAYLWIQSVPQESVPQEYLASYVYIQTATNPVIFANDEVRIRLAIVGLDLGNYGNQRPSANAVPYYIQLTLSDQVTVLAGELDFPNFAANSTSFKFIGPNTLTLGSKQYSLTVEPSPEDLPGSCSCGGGPGVSPVGAYGLWATIPLDEIAPTPEPSSFVLAGMGGVGFVGLVWGRRRKRQSSACKWTHE